MAWTTIPDADLDGGSPLKTGDVLTNLRDNPEAIFAGTAPYFVKLFMGYTGTPMKGYLRPDGDEGVVLSPMETSEIYVIDETDPAWPIPAHARQIIVEAWGGGGAYGWEFQFNAKAGFAGAYCMKLLDVDHAGGYDTLSVTIGEGGISEGGGDTVVSYKTTTLTAQGGEGNNQNLGFALGTGGDVNIGGGAGPSVRGGGNDPDTGDGIMGSAGAPTMSAATSPGGRGRVVVRVIG